MAQDEEQSPKEQQPPDEPERAASPPDLSDHLAAELGGLDAVLAARASSETPVDEKPASPGPDEVDDEQA